MFGTIKSVGSYDHIAVLLAKLLGLSLASCGQGSESGGGETREFVDRIEALGATGESHVGPALERQLEGDDVASAAAALADLDYDAGYDRMLRGIPRPRDTDFSTPSMAGLASLSSYFRAAVTRAPSLNWSRIVQCS